MVAIEKYREGLISLEELVYELYSINGDVNWVKDCLDYTLDSVNYTHAMEILDSI